MAPTHIAFATMAGFIFKADLVTGIPLLIGGALLPDLDHPRSFIGRIFFFLSIPLDKYFGHRGTIHGYPLWGAIALTYFIWPPLGLVGLGALSHVFLDMWNVSGVKAFMPFTQRVAVLFKRDWRITTGGKGEIVVMMLLIIMTYGGQRMGAVGGLKAMIGHLTGSPKIMVEEYQRQGLTRCWAEGKMRWANGSIEEGKWLIVGMEGANGMAIIHDNRLVHLPKKGHFLKAKLKKEETKWQALDLLGWARTKTDIYYLSGTKWKTGNPGDIVFGQLLGNKIELETIN